MTWLLRYRIWHYLADSIWVLPCLGMVMALLVVRIPEMTGMEGRVISGDAGPTAMALLETLASSMFTFIVFVSSALLLAVQLASAQLTPRIISFLFKDLVTKLSLALFTFTSTFTLAVLVRIGHSIPMVSIRIAVFSCMASLFIFFFLIDHVGKFLRPSGALRNIGIRGHLAIEHVYPIRLENRASKRPSLGGIDLENPTLTVVSPGEGVLLAINIPGIILLAKRENCVIELVPQIGRFVGPGETLFRVCHSKSERVAAVLRSSVAFGQERTINENPAFACRIIVDVACKALSPAINDPTTAVIAIDQLDYLLREIGSRDLDNGLVTDASGQLRLILHRPAWADFVRLAVTEIRLFGGESIQVTRRLRAMLESLTRALPNDRVDLLHQELKILQRRAKRLFLDPEDQAMASVSDSQGVGGSSDEKAGGEEKAAEK